MQDFNSTMRWGDMGKVSPSWSRSSLQSHLSPVRSRKCIPVSETQRKGRPLLIRFALHISIWKGKQSLQDLFLFIFISRYFHIISNRISYVQGQYHIQIDNCFLEIQLVSLMLHKDSKLKANRCQPFTPFCYNIDE